MIGDQKRIQPRKKSADERIDAADDEKQQKFSGEEMITDTIEDPHSDNSFKKPCRYARQGFYVVIGQTVFFRQR